MYSNVNELPTEVRNSLDEEDCAVWMQAYNSKDPKTEEEIAVAKKYAWEQCKTLPSSFSFDIIASVEDVDSDGELITIDTLKEQMDGFINQGGTSQDEHGNYHVATIWDWEDYTDPDTGYPGVIVHGNVFGGRGENSEYAQARQDFIDGKNSLSIAGDADVVGYECDEDRCYVRRNLTQLMEISLVENPANPYARLLWYNDKAVVKGGVRKSADAPAQDPSKSMTFKVKSVDIHKSYNECDLQRMVRMLKGYDCKVTSKGVEVADGTADLIAKMVEGIGHIVSIDPIIVDSDRRILEKEFKRAFVKGYCDKDGRLTSRIDKAEFVSLYNKGVIKDDRGWRFDSSIIKSLTDHNIDIITDLGVMRMELNQKLDAIFTDMEDLIWNTMDAMAEKCKEFEPDTEYPDFPTPEYPLEFLRKRMKEEIWGSMDRICDYLKDAEDEIYQGIR